MSRVSNGIYQTHSLSMNNLDIPVVILIDRRYPPSMELCMSNKSYLSRIAIVSATTIVLVGASIGLFVTSRNHSTPQRNSSSTYAAQFVDDYKTGFLININKLDTLAKDRDVVALNPVVVKSVANSNDINAIRPYIDGEKSLFIISDKSADGRRLFVEGVAGDGSLDGNIFEIDVKPLVEGYDNTYLTVVKKDDYKELLNRAKTRFETLTSKSSVGTGAH